MRGKFNLGYGAPATDQPSAAEPQPRTVLFATDQHGWTRIGFQLAQIPCFIRVNLWLKC